MNADQMGSQMRTQTAPLPAGSADLPEQRNLHAGLLRQMVEELQAGFTCERSIRLCPQGLFTNRFLLTVTKEAISAPADDKVVAVCRRLAMPADLVEAARQN